MEQVYKCLCGATKSIKQGSSQSVSEFRQSLPDKVPCGFRGCESYATPFLRNLKYEKAPLEILIEAKLAGTSEELFEFQYSTGGLNVRPFTYSFRSNEQAAALAIRALEEAGYKIVPIKRTIVENYHTYICPECGKSQQVPRATSRIFEFFPYVDCGPNCSGRAVPIEDANEAQQKDIENYTPYCITHRNYVGEFQMFRCAAGVQRDEPCVFEERE